MSGTGKDKSMSEAEIERLLRKAEVGRLGLYGDDFPYVVPVNFVYMDGKIYFHGAFKGKKLELIDLYGKVCFEVDAGRAIKPEKPGDCSFSYRSVIAYGDARLIKKHEKKLFMAAARGLFEKYAASHVPEIKEEMIEKTQMVEMKIEKMTGKKSSDLCN